MIPVQMLDGFWFVIGLAVWLVGALTAIVLLVLVLGLTTWIIGEWDRRSPKDLDASVERSRR